MSYANAYVQVIKDAGAESPSFFKQLLAYMRSKGHLALLPEIVRKLEREKIEPVGTVTVSERSDAKKFEQMIRDSLNTLGVDPKEAVLKEDADMVGGFAVRSGSRSIDRSFRTALVSIYRNTTH